MTICVKKTLEDICKMFTQEEMRGNVECRKPLMGRFTFSMRGVGPIREAGYQVRLSSWTCFVSEVPSDIPHAWDRSFHSHSTHMDALYLMQVLARFVHLEGFYQTTIRQTC